MRFSFRSGAYHAPRNRYIRGLAGEASINDICSSSVLAARHSVDFTYSRSLAVNNTDAADTEQTDDPSTL
jgi:hypothetical protein